MNRRLRNRQVRRERKRLAKQYDTVRESYQKACRKSEERLVRSLGFDPREKCGYTKMQSNGEPVAAAAGLIGLMLIAAAAGFVLSVAF